MLLLAIALLPVMGLAQGRVYFANDVLVMPPDRNVYLPDGTRAAGTNVAVQLYYSSTNQIAFVEVTNAPARLRAPGSQAGKWVGGFRTLTGILPGTTVWLQVRAWDTDLGATWDEARANNSTFGISQVFSYTVAMPGDPIEAYYMQNFSSFHPLGFNCGGGVNPVAILKNPTNQTVAAGSLAILRVVATNGCLFEWQFNGTNIVGNGTNPVSAQLPSLRLYNVGPQHAGEYRVIVRGNQTKTSAVAVLTVVLPPQLSSATRTGSEFWFYVPGEAGRTFAVETTTNLIAPTAWFPVQTNAAPFWFTNSAADADRQRFYRAVFK